MHLIRIARLVITHGKGSDHFSVRSPIQPGSPERKRRIGTDISSVTVNISVKGDRSVVSALSQSDFTVTPIFNNVTEAGTYELAIQITKNNPLLSFEITTVNPANITLKFA